MNCPSCRFKNSATMKFCVECGTRLLKLCPQCEAEMLPAYKFCGECGTKLIAENVEIEPSPSLPAPKSQPLGKPIEQTPAQFASEGERKRISVLVCTLALPETDGALAPDEKHLLLNRFFALAQPVVERFGGVVSRFLDCGFVALFGAPVAWEDHPQRAVLAALNLLENVLGSLVEEQDISYILRMGIDSGEVILGGVGGIAVGEATTRAAALAAKAQPGELLVSDRTGRRVNEQVSLESRGSMEIEGQEVEFHRARPRQEALPTIDGAALSLFVGRDRELSTLMQLRDLADQQQGQIVGIVGEAGSGKSRLLHEFYSRSHVPMDASYLRGQCLSYGSGVPYLPLVDMIRKASSIMERDDPETTAAKLRISLERVGTPLESLPYFLRLLGIDQGTETLTCLESWAIQTRTFAAMRRMILDASQHALVIVEIEDLHWIDDTSAEFLDSLIEIMAAGRVMMILTYRSGYQPRWLEKSFATEIPMRRLNEKDSERLVSELASRFDPSFELRHGLLGKADGNPLFLEELTRALLEQRNTGGSVPETIQGILMARIDALPKAHRQLLRTASVLGRTIQREVLEAIWGEESPMDPLLDDLQRWELIYKAPSEDRISYVFKHALTQEVAYDSLLSNRRRTLHTHAAEALEAQHAEHLEEIYPQLIYHYPRAGEPAKTVHYLTLFAQRAAQGFAHAEAARALSEALPHIELLTEQVREHLLVEVLLQLAESLLPLARFPETLELFEKYQSRLEDLDDPTLAGRYYFWLAHTHTYMGQQALTRKYSELSIAAAQAASDEATEGKACYVLGRDGFWSGRFSDGHRYSQRAIVMLERTGEAWWQGQAFWVAGFNHFALGQFDLAIEALEQCCAIGEALDDLRLDASWSLGYFYSSLGESKKGIRYCRQGLERSQDPLNSAVSTGFLGHALLVEGEQLEEAFQLLDTARNRMQQTGMIQLEGWFAILLSEVLLARGEIEQARTEVLSGLQLTRQSEFQFGTGLGHHVLGKIECSGEQFEKAAQALKDGKRLFEKLEAPFELGKISLDLARLATRQKDPALAKDELAVARDIFDQLNVPRYAQIVEDLELELACLTG